MTAAIYSRVSKHEQDPEHQLRPLREFAGRRGDFLEFVDHGVSGSRASRPALDRMLAGVFSREITAVTVTSLSRLGRSTEDVLKLIRKLREADCSLCIIDSQVDTSTAAGRAFLEVMAVFANLERSFLIERTKAGLETARARGVKLGRKPALSGAQRHEVIRLRADGMSIRNVARRMKVAKSTIERVVRS